MLSPLVSLMRFNSVTPILKRKYANDPLPRANSKFVGNSDETCKITLISHHHQHRYSIVVIYWLSFALNANDVLLILLNNQLKLHTLKKAFVLC